MTRIEPSWSATTRFIISVYYAYSAPTGANLRFDGLRQANEVLNLDFAFLAQGVPGTHGSSIRPFFTRGPVRRRLASLSLQIALSDRIVILDSVPALPFRRHFLLVHDCGNLFSGARRSGRVRSCFYRAQLRLIRNFVTVSASTSRVLRKLGFGVRHVVSPNSLGFAVVPTPQGRRDIDFLFVTSGAHHKRDETIYALIRATYPDATVYMAGAGLERIFDGRLSPPPVFIDKPTGEQLATLYARSTIYVTYSRVEGFGMTVLEALSKGCRCLLSDIPCFRELFGTVAAVRFLPTKNPTRADLERAVTALRDTAAPGRDGQPDVARLQWPDILRGLDHDLQTATSRR